MKKIFLLLFFITSATFGFSQITWDDATPDTVYSLETNPDVETHNIISFSDSGTYRWERSLITTCPITSAICDKNTCYLDNVETADFFVEANESFKMICHFYPNDNCCKNATVKLKVYLISDPTVSSEAEYNISLWCSSASVSDLTSSLTLFPNPAQDVLFVEGVNSTMDKADIRIYNSTGKEVIQTVYSENSGVNIESLKAGLYNIEVQTSLGILRKKFVKM